MKNASFTFDMASCGLRLVACAPGEAADFPQVLDPELITLSETFIAAPPMFKVFMHDDAFTTFDFAIHVLKKHFGSTDQEALNIAQTTHNEGICLVGVFTREMAEHKVAMANEEARQTRHPILPMNMQLKFSCEME